MSESAQFSKMYEHSQEEINEPSEDNELVSYANPNYQLIPSDENCNVEVDDIYDDLYEGLDISCRISRKPTIRNRRKYASLDPSSMGVDVELETTPMLNASSEDNLNQKETVKKDENFDSNDNQDIEERSSFLEYFINLEAASQKNSANQSVFPCNGSVQKASTQLVPDKDSRILDCKESLTKNNIKHIQGKLNNDLYAVPSKKISKKQDEPETVLNVPAWCSATPVSENSSSESSVDNSLPSGWEKHEDDSGPYYWHISSGTIQREPPVLYLSNKALNRSSKDLSEAPNEFCSSSCKTKSCAVNTSEHLRSKALHIHTVAEKMKRKSFPGGSCSLTQDKRPIRFAVRSLGWVEIAEADLTPERSSKAVNKCIIDLSMGRNDILDVVGRWGDGKDLFMDLDDYSLRLMDTQDMTVLNTQPIHTIRVWGVGRDNGRDFAYVARDRVIKKHMCHVFRCDIPARIIANTLRDICKKIMIERSLQHSLAKNTQTSKEKHDVNVDSNRGPIRPSNLPMDQQFQNGDVLDPFSAHLFPTPMEEPKKVLKVHYLGSMNVQTATGVEVLNDAIELLSTTIPLSEYKYVNVAVAPSTITISEPGEDGKQLAECRVRFLSFLGIGKNIKHCGFIVHTAIEEFVAHVFYCEPSSGALCKTIEAACKLRYQKCLDAHKQGTEKKNSDGVKNKFSRAYKAGPAFVKKFIKDLI